MTATNYADVRQGIIDAAMPLFMHKGFNGVGLTELLGAAKVPKGSFYHYFGSKEVFGAAVIDSYFERTLARIDDLLARGATGREGLLNYFEDWRECQLGESGQCLAVKLGAEVSDLSEALRASLHRGVSGITSRLVQSIERGMADGSLQQGLDAKVLAIALYQSWVGASLLAKINHDRAPLDTAMAGTRQVLNLTQQA
ncbi:MULTISPECIES: TetR/AcrR family transcriptional regulator [unclassified Duganella]|uniref:TetR/AcrR family transcriptional regulator n=1 Tax=unclassified Duganella TaxID=2636909 RepID=UPI000701BACF|nr:MULTISPECIES: TetR/AcrR family transcriptional regulator [unclassified Duganella]KQV61873.1 TetR family transcriptional regulator [Duganella sp. Root336D2]KRB84382.1 TetR family transcriptional regulator [Duganella sp. Root198D2]